jgi:general transcriptional corepressor CYC8
MRFAISFISQIGFKHLERMAGGKYSRSRYRTIERARRAWIRDYFNDPAHFWRGDSSENRSKGASGEDIDEPTEEEAARERERRRREQRDRERLAREREREERDRERERERRERERERRP